MSNTAVLIAVVSYALGFLSLFIITGILWARVKGAEQFAYERFKEFRSDLDSVEAKVPESRLQAVEATVGALRTRVDGSAIENDTYREQVHKSMQRFNAIMRRNERALPARRGSTDPDDDGTPDEIPLGDVRPLDHQSARPTRAELRDELRRKSQPK